MEKIYIVYCVLALSLIGNARCQTHIYERYADSSDLEVAYIEHLPLDSANAINVTIIIAKDSAAWEWLKTEFHIKESVYPVQAKSVRLAPRDKQDPTSPQRKSILESYLMATNYSQKTLLIYQYETIEQYKSIIRYSTNKVLQKKLIQYEKD